MNVRLLHFQGCRYKATTSRCALTIHQDCYQSNKTPLKGWLRFGKRGGREKNIHIPSCFHFFNKNQFYIFGTKFNEQVSL